MNPSPGVSLAKVTDSLALAGKAIKSKRVKPVTFPAECFPIFPTRFSFPCSLTNEDFYIDIRGSPFSYT